MGLINGSVGYLRFVAMGDLSEVDETALCEALAAHAFRDIDPFSEEERTYGWVRFDDPFSSNWGPGELIREGGLIVLRLRVDTLKVPAMTLKAYIQAAERDRMIAAGRESLTRPERDAVKTDVRKDLRGRSLAKLALVDVAWNLSTGEVRLFSTGRGVAQLFVELFEKTFAVELRTVGPRTVLWLRGMLDDDLDLLAYTDVERFNVMDDGAGGAAEVGAA